MSEAKMPDTQTGLWKKINPDTLVVQSMPFGALIDNVTREQFTPPIPDSSVAYGLARAVKLAAEHPDLVKALEEAKQFLLVLNEEGALNGYDPRLTFQIINSALSSTALKDRT